MTFENASMEDLVAYIRARQDEMTFCTSFIGADESGLGTDSTFDLHGCLSARKSFGIWRK